MYKALLSAAVNNARTKTMNRQVDLDEAKFASSERQAKRYNDAVDRLAGITAGNLDNVDARDMAIINQGNLASMFSYGASKNNKSQPASLAIYNAMVKQQKEMGLNSPFETPLYAFYATSQQKKSGKTQEEYFIEVKRDLSKALLNNPVFTMQKGEKKQEMADLIDHLARYTVYGDAVAIDSIKVPEIKNPDGSVVKESEKDENQKLIDQTIKEFLHTSILKQAGGLLMPGHASAKTN